MPTATTTQVLDALRADRTALLDLCADFGDADWKADSGCAGWSVQDVVSHVGALYWLVVDPSRLPDTGGAPTEAAQDQIVEARRSLSADEVFADYADVSEQAIAGLAGLLEQDFTLPLGDLGTYHASQLALPYAFDHYVHIRADLFAPRGPLPADRAPADDELRLQPALDWVEAAVPQQNTELVSGLTGTIELHATGPVTRTVAIGTGPTTAEVTGDAPALLRALTQRGTWDELGIEATGHAADLAIARRLKVF